MCRGRRWGRRRKVESMTRRELGLLLLLLWLLALLLLHCGKLLG